MMVMMKLRHHPTQVHSEKFDIDKPRRGALSLDISLQNWENQVLMMKPSEQAKPTLGLDSVVTQGHLGTGQKSVNLRGFKKFMENVCDESPRHQHQNFLLQSEFIFYPIFCEHLEVSYCKNITLKFHCVKYKT